MKTNILATAIALSDRDLLARLDTIARTEREAVAELLAHLAALELRPSLYLGDGYGSLFDYCTRALRLSEDAACTRIQILRACQRFPVILDDLASGALSVTSVRRLAPHLTAENHESVLARARDKRLEEIQSLVAELAPRPDVPASIRKLPVHKATASAPVLTHGSSSLPMPLGPDDPRGEAQDLWTPQPAPRTEASPRTETSPQSEASLQVSSPTTTLGQDGAPPPVGSPAFPPLRRPDPRPIIQALAPQRYRVQFTIGQQAHDDLRAVQTLLRREIPSGDPGVIFERALGLLRKEVEKAKLGVGAKPRRTSGKRRQDRVYENRIRFKTDNHQPQGASHQASQEVDERGATHGHAPKEHPAEAEPVRNASRSTETPRIRQKPRPSRHISNAVKRIVWYRDRGQCAFVSPSGRRCAECNFLELHHIQPYARDGEATAGNIALRCRRHNQYEAELVFGLRTAPRVSEDAPGG